MNIELYDISIIGAGPVGLYAGFYAGMRNVKTQIIESLPQIGGQLTAIYPEKYIYDIGGQSKIKAYELIKQLEEQVLRVPDVEIRTSESVINIEEAEDAYLITTSKGKYLTKSIILATGNGSFNPRKLQVKFDEKLENDKIFYHVSNLDDFRDQKVIVAGGGDSAIDLALMLEEVAEQVSIVHRRDEFRALEESVRQLQLSSVEVLTSYKIKELEETSQGLKLALVKNKTKDVLNLESHKILVNYGFASSSNQSDKWNIKLETEHNMYKVDNFMQTNMKQIYAIGDGAIYPGKLKLIAQGFGEGPTAVHQIVSKLYPENKGTAHSTSIFK